MSNYDENILGQDAAAIVQSFIDEKQLEKWQKHFSDVQMCFCAVWMVKVSSLLPLAGRRMKPQ